MKIGIIAGEASGDLLGAQLISALREHCPALQVEGIGGPAMIEAGCESLFSIERLSIMGLIEPLLHLPDLIKLRRDIYSHFIANPPDVFIGIDAPDFNLGLEKKLKKAGIKVIHYVSPSVWAWRRRRIHKIAKAIDLMLTLFPFEAKFYEAHHIPVKYIGHPLANEIPMEADQIAARKFLKLEENTTYIALLPGSRGQELYHMAEPFLLAAQKAYEKNSKLHFLTTHINEKRYQEFKTYHKQFAPNLPLTFFINQTSNVLAAADFVLVTSGTATLQVMLYKKPMLIAYKMSRLTYFLAKIFIRKLSTKYIGLPNILANESLVPELIQNEVDPNKIANHMLTTLNHLEKFDDVKRKFSDIHQTLLVKPSSYLYSVISSLIRND